MSIHVAKDGTPVVFSGQEAVNFFRMIALLQGMKTELKTGMRLTRGPSCFTRVKQEYGLKGNKQTLIDQFQKLVSEENQRMEYRRS